MLILAVPLSASAVSYSGEFGVDGNNLRWEIDSAGILTISGEGKMTVGNEYILPPWDEYRTIIKKVVIEDGVLNIASYTFSYLDIEEITFPNTVEDIYYQAIRNCEKLKVISIPASVKNIETSLYWYCNKVEKIVVDNNNQWYCSDDSGALFNKEKTVLYHYPASNTTDFYSVPETVETIGEGAFYGNTYLKSIHITDNVLNIERWAFMYCESLETVKIPKNLKIISGQSFCNCYALKEIAIPDGVTKISYYAFQDCRSLKEITVPASVTFIYNNPFNGCQSLENLIVDTSNPVYYSKDNCIIDPANKTLIAGCKNSIIPSDGSVEIIGPHAFMGTTGITKILIPDTIIKIGTYAFGDCSDLVFAEIPDSVLSIGSGIFMDCPKLKAVIIGKGITSITENTFQESYRLSHVTIPDTVEEIKNAAFSNTYSLAHIGYCGSEEKWNSIVMGNNDTLQDIEYLHFNFNPETDITVEIIETTCTETGSKTYKCSCGYTISEEISAIGHTYDSSITAPTCTKQGFTTYTCECGDSYVADYIDANGHDYTSVITKEATHLEEGIKTFTCFCGDSYTEIIAKIEAHDYKATVTEPTCTEQGFTTYTCECSDSYVADYVDANGHDYTSVITKEATHLEEGIKTFTCFCGDSYTETIAKIDAHDYKAYTTEPTCTKQGFTTYTCECGDSYVSDYVDAVGHDLTGWVNDEENGTAARECSRCDYIETVPLTNQGDGNVEIIAPENPEIDFEIDNIETNSDQFIVIEKIVTDNLRTDWKVIKAFDITLKNSDGVHVQPGGIVKVKLPLDWEKDGNYKVYRVNDDGTLTDMNAYRQGSHMVFGTDHFSIYVIVEEIVQEEKPSTEKLSFFDFINNIVNCFMNIITSIINFFRSIGDYT